MDDIRSITSLSVKFRINKVYCVDKNFNALEFHVSDELLPKVMEIFNLIMPLPTFHIDTYLTDSLNDIPDFKCYNNG